MKYLNYRNKIMPKTTYYLHFDISNDIILLKVGGKNLEKVVGIVAEYNPLHNGHAYHIKMSKELTGAKYAIAVIGGNFTQRGEASVISKWEKTKMALYAGADLVIELPCIYSISSAENFADGAIKLLDSLGIVDYLSFGMENDNLEELDYIANILFEEDEEYKKLLKSELNSGISYPKARQNAIENYVKNKDNQDNYDIASILSSPNNILGIEYLKALKRHSSKIKPIGIKREKVSYNSSDVIDNFASGTGIRNLIKEGKLENVSKVMPEESCKILFDNINNGTYINDFEQFSKVIIYKLRNMSAKEIANLPEVSEGLENLIKEASNNTNKLSELIDSIKSKRYTQTRIQRILLYVLLGISKQDAQMSRNIVPYIRVLGYTKNGRDLLHKLDAKDLVISVKKYEESLLKRQKELINIQNLKRMLDIDKIASDIYTIGYKDNSKSSLDYTQGIISI